MDLLDFEHSLCARVQGNLDGYLSQEPSSEWSSGFEQHLKRCAACQAVLENRRQTRELLRRVVNQEQVPSGLQQRIHLNLRGSASTSNRRQPWAIAAAAAILLSLGGYVALHWISSRTAEESAVAAALKVGVDDHIHCALGSWYRGRQFSDDDMAHKLGPQFAGLAPLVRSQISDDANLVVAHQCQVRGRNFIHLIVTKPQETISLIVTRKESESLASGGSGKPFVNAGMEKLQVAGFETRDYLAYIVSDLPEAENRALASKLATPVRDYLARLES